MKLGIVMEGGASRTIFSCGVTDVFMDENIYPDYLLGVSAGIGYGVSYASHQRGRNAEFTRKYMHLKKYMGMHHWLNPRKRCYYNLDFAFGEIPNKLIPYDYDALANYPGKVVATVTNVATGQPEYIEIPKYERHWETTIASCSLPVLFPTVKIGKSRYLDGGISDPIPYKQVMREGCDRIVVILTRERDYIMKNEKAMKLILLACRKYPKIAEQMKLRAEHYNHLTQELLEQEKKGNIFLIAPKDTYGVKRTESDWRKLEPLYEEGLAVARERMPELKAYLMEE